MVKVNSILVLLLLFVVSSCANQDDHQELVRVQDTRMDTMAIQEFEIHSQNAIDSLSEFRLYQINKSFKFSPGQEIDFKNFTYENCILRNGVSYIEEEYGFDTTRLINDYQVTDSLYLVELYEYFGGGSSELMKIIYLYKREPNSLVHLSTLTCSGNYPIILDSNKLIVKADNYLGGQSARCCPWKYEIAEFEISEDNLKYVSRKFEKIEE